MEVDAEGDFCEQAFEAKSASERPAKEPVPTEMETLHKRRRFFDDLLVVSVAHRLRYNTRVVKRA